MNSEKTIFQKIIQGEIPSYKIYEDDKYFVFLDIRPISLGHTLIIPKEPIDYFFDLDNETYKGVLLLAKEKIAPAIQKATQCPRVGMVVEGFGVPHAHLHLVPIYKIQGLDPNLQHEESAEKMIEIQEKIKSFL